MNASLRQIKYEVLLLFRSKSFLFWTVAFPLLLAIFYKFAFGNLLIKDEFETINVGIESNSYLKYVFDEIEIINPVVMDDISDISERDDIDVSVDSELNMYVKGRGINETIVKSIVDQIIEMNELKMPIDSYDFTKSYVNQHNEEENGLLLSFYMLVAMFSFYSAFSTNGVATQSKGELSVLGMRKDISALKRVYFIIPTLMANIAINMTMNFLLIVFIENVLDVRLINNLSLTVFLILFGNIFGASFGLFLGSLNIANRGLKDTIIRGFMLLAAGLNGMTGPDVKLIIDNNFPIINKFNPIGVLTDNLLRVNMLNNTSHIKPMTVLIGAYSIILLSIAYIQLRRKTYDSI
ncbi:MAG: ABC transporter permease [Tissierellia bacterium]|nr:ABC transporter permease [Tissierellia bacterium]